MEWSGFEQKSPPLRGGTQTGKEEGMGLILYPLDRDAPRGREDGNAQRLVTFIPILHPIDIARLAGATIRQEANRLIRK